MNAVATNPKTKLSPEVAEFCARAVAALRAKLPVREVWLFGSQAEGTANEHSDVDLFVVLADDHGLTRPTLECRRVLRSLDNCPAIDIATLTQSRWNEPSIRGFGIWSDIAEKGICLRGNVSSVPLGFGVRGLDPALTFGGTPAVSRTMATRMATPDRPACDNLSTLRANPDERKSGVKPPHSKASRHSGSPIAPETWFARATEDLNRAQLTGNDPQWCAELCRNAAENALKGWLIARGWKLPRTRTLAELNDAASEHGLDLSAFAADLATLEPFNSESRYPGNETPDLSEAEAAYLLSQTENLLTQLSL